MNRRIDLVWVVLALVALILGIWLGVAGAELSPVFTEAPAVVAPGGPGR